MKVYTKVVIDMNDNRVIESDSYDYDGPVSQCFELGGGGSQAYGQASEAMAAAINQAIAEERKMYEQTRTDLGPYRDIGEATTPLYGGVMGVPGYDRVDLQDYLRTTPGYEWQLGQGAEALNRQAASKGMLGSGAFNKGLMTFGQGMADKNYGSYMDRLYNLLGTGQNAAAQTGQFGAKAAGDISNLYTQLGQSQAQGIMGQYQAGQSGMSNLLGGLGLLGGLALSPAPSAGWFGKSMIGSLFS